MVSGRVLRRGDAGIGVVRGGRAVGMVRGSGCACDEEEMVIGLVRAVVGLSDGAVGLSPCCDVCRGMNTEEVGSCRVCHGVLSWIQGVNHLSSLD